MSQVQEARAITKEVIDNYAVALQEDEKSTATISKYTHDLRMAAEHFDGVELTKQALIKWKDLLVEKYSASTVNSILAALNGFLKHMGWNDLMVKPLKIQKSMFQDENRELTQDEYRRLGNP